jgi:DNA-binding response OmpR family regulator
MAEDRGPKTDNQQRGTVLFADDEPLLRELGETILTQAGYKVLTAPDSDALKSLLTEYSGAIDLLLTDVNMPGISGPELAALVRERRPNIRVLYMSGWAADEIKNLDPGAVFLQKPFSPSELTAKVAAVMGQASGFGL